MSDNVADQKRKLQEAFHMYLKCRKPYLKDEDRKIVSKNLFDILQSLEDDGIIRTKGDLESIGGPHRLPRYAISREYSDDVFDKKAKSSNLTKGWSGYYKVIRDAAAQKHQYDEYYLFELFEGSKVLEEFEDEDDTVFEPHVEHLYDWLNAAAKSIISQTKIADYFNTLSKQPVSIDLLTGGDFCVGGYRANLEEFLNKQNKVCDAGPTLLAYVPLYYIQQGKDDNGELIVSGRAIDHVSRSEHATMGEGNLMDVIPSLHWFYPTMGTRNYSKFDLKSKGLGSSYKFPNENIKDMDRYSVERRHFAEVGITIFPSGPKHTPELAFYVRQKTEIWHGDNQLQLSTNYWNDYLSPIYYIRTEDDVIFKAIFISDMGYEKFPWTDPANPFDFTKEGDVVNLNFDGPLQGDWFYFEKVSLSTINHRLNITPEEGAVVLAAPALDIYGIAQECPHGTIGAMLESSLFGGDDENRFDRVLKREIIKKIDSFQKYNDELHALRGQRMGKLMNEWKVD